MKFSSFTVFGVLVLGSLSAQAQYFSEGWKPGETSVAEPEATYIPGQSAQPPPQVEQPQTQAPKKSLGSVLELLQPDKLLGTVLDKFGFNITAKLNELPWDERIPLVTDDNYKDLIVNEQFESEQEAKDRTWAIVVTVSGSRQEPLSKLVDEMFDSAYSKSIAEGDLPDVRWGRIDYFNVTYLTTKWNVWKAPYLILARDRGQTLYFFRPGNIRIHDDSLRTFLKTQGYLQLPPWSGIWAPGGEREWLLEIFAVWMARVYNIATRIPHWILFIASGGIASMVLSFIHKPAKQPPRKKVAPASNKAQTIPASPQTPTSPVVATNNANQRAAESPSPSKRSARQRKGKKANT